MTIHTLKVTSQKKSLTLLKVEKGMMVHYNWSLHARYSIKYWNGELNIYTSSFQ